MVMADNPSPPPQSHSAEVVGREFVRQYYTLLNEAPFYLHRFYNKNSSFVHGGVDAHGNPEEAVIGQAIREKIEQLDFRDCHTKIKQVDSHATVGDGVVVQVSGELSNNAKPMRRFMQTFVLAPQTAKNYYVRNDIFRYQDEVFNDSEDSETENVEEVPAISENDVEDVAVAQATIPEPVQDPAVTSYYEPQPSTVSNGIPRIDSPEVMKPTEDEEVASEPSSSGEQPPIPDPVVENHTPEPEDEDPGEEKVLKPVSWAERARGGAPPVHNIAVVNTVPGKYTSHTPPAPVSAKQEVAQSSRNDPLPQREVRSKDRGSRGNPRRFPDNQQLFVGNLPLDVEEEELKQFFSSYGQVLETRISKNTMGKIPYFGFVVFETTQPVQNLLKMAKQQEQILFRGTHRLNVEEKKPRGSDSRPRGRGNEPRFGGPPRGGASGRGGGRGNSSGVGKGGGSSGGRGFNPQR
ncbi:ras GTPase-activating protein-binding protein 2-like [Anneissia japonica]|uniref:ras GTPase-activating protein-binding protein 2-like n=1 Tax=Anneissia japonica TaxID=1529436 RepID=UPI001425AA1A|nr:ras GTPase-activating protein-binding protein 2-like [Anneissia japonica]